MNKSIGWALWAVLVGCTPTLEVGHYACSANAECPEGWYCWQNQLCYDGPEALPTGDGGGLDATRLDASPRDAANDVGPRDATPDSGEHDGGPDGSIDLDASPGDGDSDGGPDADLPDVGSCVSEFGDACDRTGYCGSVYDCVGACIGGSPAPSCACGAATCGRDGAWSTCPGPTDYGSDCSTSERCHGQIGCSGACEGGAPAPVCPCAPAVCEPGGWSNCIVPTGYDTACNTATRCDGRVACDGSCQGGNPLPTCQCGTPTCGGCQGGTCGANSQCVAGQCECSMLNSCTGCAPNSSCQVCGPGGSVDACSTDAFGCGVVTNTTNCQFGCGGSPPQCLCSPNQGTTCFVGTCTCACGTFPRLGTYDCQGACLGAPGCAVLCLDNCGRCDPLCR